MPHAARHKDLPPHPLPCVKINTGAKSRGEAAEKGFCGFGVGSLSWPFPQHWACDDIHTHTYTRLMGTVTAVTFAGAGPQTGRRGPREPQAAIVLSPRKPASLCQTCFSVCFLFYVFNVGKGECFPSHLPMAQCYPPYHPSSPPPPAIHPNFFSTPPCSIMLSPCLPPGDCHL